MQRTEVVAKLIQMLSKQLHIESALITEDSRLFDDLGADSLDTAELTLMIQDDFGYNLDDEEVKSVKTVKDIVDRICSNKSAHK